MFNLQTSPIAVHVKPFPSCLVLSLRSACLSNCCSRETAPVLSCLVAVFSLFVRTQRVGVSRSLLPTSLFGHLSMGQARNPPTLGTTLCVSRALMPTLAVKPPHVCHRHKDWAVSMGSHMQQDMDIPRRLHTKVLRPLCFEYRSHLKIAIQKVGDSFA